MLKSYFISDAHIGAECEEKEAAKREKLLKFFELVEKDGKLLFILGDFFDFWFEYSTVVHKKYFEILCRLKNISDKSIEVNFLCGNHDLWAGKSFEEITGAKVHNKILERDICGKKFFLSHGDGIAKCDWGYRLFLKPLLKCPVLISLFRLIHPDLAWKISRIISSSSRLYNEKRNLKFEDEYKEFAKKLLSQKFDFVVLGHIHTPQKIEFDSGTYILLGDFFKNFTYGVFDGSSFSILEI